MEISFKEILFRIQQLYGHKNASETARFLGVSPQIINNWKSRNSPDYKLIIEKCSNHDLNWILTGLRSPSSTNYSPEELTEKAEAKSHLADLMIKKSMLLVENPEKAEDLREEIVIINRALKYL